LFISARRARRKAAVKHGGGLRRVDLDQLLDDRADELLALDEAHQEAAEALGIGRRAADRLWALAKAWLYQRISRGKPPATIFPLLRAAPLSFSH